MNESELHKKVPTKKHKMKEQFKVKCNKGRLWSQALVELNVTAESRALLEEIGKITATPLEDSLTRRTLTILGLSHRQITVSTVSFIIKNYSENE